MYFKLYFLLCFNALIVCINSELTVCQYVRKLDALTEKAKTYKLNVDNSEFFKNLDTTVRDYGTFDYIVVGAGSTGGVLSSLLAAQKKFSVLLIEAGGEEDEITDIPSQNQISQFSERNWGYLTTPQKTCCQGMKDKRCMQPRGKVIGGTSVLNSLMYVRGYRTDYDNWSKMGLSGWSYKDVLPYFIKQENVDFPDAEMQYHGRGGLLNVAYSEPPDPLVDYFIEGNKELGLEQIDYNGANSIGVSRVQSNIKNGRRQSTGRVYVDKFRHYSNFNVTTHALATKILTEKSGILKQNKAKGVQFVKDGKTYKANAKKAVIISGGSINTPQLLMLSGIGPKKQLSKHKIETIVDLPVGEGLIDHASFVSLTYRTNLTAPATSNKENIQQYLQGKGPFTRGGGAVSLALLDIDETTKGRPEIELILLPPPSVNDPLTTRQMNFDKELAEGYVAKANPQTDYTLFTVLLHPKSRGSVTLKSNSPKDFPNIDFKFFSDENDEDIETMYKGIQHTMKLAKTDKFKQINTSWLKLPICKEHEEDNKKYWYCLIRHAAATMYHPSSTAKMGPVLNNQLLVHSFSNLYVADASVFPTAVSGHVSPPCMMIGVKLAEELMERYK